MLNDKDGSGIERFSNSRDQMNGDPAMHERLIRMPEVTRTVGLNALSAGLRFRNAVSVKAMTVSVSSVS